MNKPDEARLEMLEGFFTSIIDNGMNPRLILTALHNVCVHGEKLEKAGWNVTNENLKQLFDGFDISLEAFKSMCRL